MEYYNNNMLILNPQQDVHILKGLASEIRVQILCSLQDGPMNINDIARKLSLPQSTVATNVLALEKCGLIETEMQKASKGTQKICRAPYSEFVVRFHDAPVRSDDVITVEMPIGLYINCQISPPCGLCSPRKIIGYLDAPESYLEPDRVKAGLLWFEKGSVQYQFPNNSFSVEKPVSKLELSLELSSETPGTNPDWPSDISITVNDKVIGTWTSPGDYGDKRGRFTPDWWKLEGSSYGILTTWSVKADGTYIDGRKISSTGIADLHLDQHHSIRVTIGVNEDAKHVGGINIFGRGFGNHDQDIVLRLFF
ncbi:MAG: ArsR family transcriptional regulator [Spirochaetaceae bacterium]|nr:ArsR family transcriptional regulator [Spirochaetaceae bacterium]MDT8298453.1 ArsR family transcriptional regulator [Spirochaetaceae bacterium]